MFSSLFILFVLAHLTGDFVLQTNKIAAMKARSIKGIALHSGIITAVQTLFLGFFGLNGFLAAVICGVVHFGIDLVKYWSQKLFSRIETVYFFLDQFMHLLVIGILSRSFLAGEELDHRLVPYLLYALSLVIVSYVSTVVVKILIRDLFSEFKKQLFFLRRERMGDAIMSILLWLSWIVHPLTAIAVIPPVFFLYQWAQQKSYNYSLKISAVKFTLLSLVSCLTALILMV